MASSDRPLGRLVDTRTFFFVCDMQDGFRQYIEFYEAIVTVVQRLVAAAKILEIPVIVTEHKGFGSTVADIDVSTAKVFTKTRFSMLIPEVDEEIKSQSTRKSVVIFGVMTDCCVQQTTLDLLERGYDVHVIVDACSTRTQVCRKFAIKRLKAAGAFITTSESMLYELMKDTEHPKFKEVDKLLMTDAPDSGLL
ncbi:isochorismatase domain-containing protein 2-like [Dysidea avara]|uniref:isochorismatase domain-containing protein 2-like n=1 Tax=Dysidea avara TaxID=196820 RepID=UPI00331EE77A